MSRHEIRESKDFANGVLQPVIGAAAGIAFVAGHDGAPLAVAHGSGSAIGEQVNKNMLAAEIKQIEIGFSNPFFAFIAGADTNGFNHFDFIRFCVW
ncbi:hypothetical protein DSECCO2_586470 [anaerobic digester metagenome]